MLPPLLISRDLILVAQRPADIVQSLEQGVFPEIVDLEVQDAAVRCGDGLCFQIHLQAVSFVCLDFSE